MQALKKRVSTPTYRAQRLSHPPKVMTDPTPIRSSAGKAARQVAGGPWDTKRGISPLSRYFWMTLTVNDIAYLQIQWRQRPTESLTCKVLLSCPELQSHT